MPDEPTGKRESISEKAKAEKPEAETAKRPSKSGRRVVTKAAAVARDEAIYALRISGLSWPEIARRSEEFGPRLAMRQCQAIYAEQRKTQRIHISTLDPSQVVEEMLDMYGHLVGEAAKLREDTDQDAVKLGAIHVQMKGMEKIIALMQETNAPEEPGRAHGDQGVLRGRATGRAGARPPRRAGGRPGRDHGGAAPRPELTVVSGGKASPWRLRLASVPACRKVLHGMLADRHAGRAESRRSFIDFALQIPEPKSGELDFRQFPYQRELYSQEVAYAREGVIVKSTQVGVSAWLMRWVIFFADTGKTGLYVFPHHRYLGEFSQQRIKPLIQKSDYLRERVPPEHINNVHQRQINNGWLNLRGSQSKEALDSVDADLVAFDEYDTLVQANIPDAERRDPAHSRSG